MNDGSSRWHRVNEILERVLDQPPDQREAMAREACGNDESLVRQVLALLRHDSEPDPIRARMMAAMDDLVRGNDEPSSLLGMTIGPFVLNREIARGGMGQVFEARRSTGDFEQTVAIKLLPGHRLNDEARLRFAVERQILAGLQHPNIAQLIDGGTLDDGMPYIIMEYVDGVRIDQFCRDHQLSNQAIIELILQVCDAVQLAHRKLVVHRDIKPANILIDPHGRPKLLDFGIAKLLDADAGTPGEHTRTGLRLLTPAYASPEQIQGGDITTAVDVYALGLLSYVLLTHRLPYRGDSTDPHALERQILSVPPEAPSDALLSREPSLDASPVPDWSKQQRRALKGDLDTILLTALRKEPERRYPSVQAFAGDLQNHLAHRPIQARPESRAYRLKLLLRRHPVAMPVSALAITLALAGGAAFTWLLAEQRDQALASEARALRTAEFAASLLSSASAHEGAEHLMPVSELLTQADQRIADELADEPLVAMPLHLALGEAHMSWGQYPQALAQAELARELAVLNDRPLQQARALDLLSRLHDDMGNMDLALALSEQALGIFQQVGTLAEQARSLSGIAFALNGTGRREQALPLFEQAEQALHRLHGGDHRDVAWLINNQGWALHALGRHAEAMQRYDAALAMLYRLDQPAQFEQASTLNNRAGLFYDLGQLQPAIRDWRQALEIFDAMFGGPGHAGLARAHNVLATGLREQGRLDEAIDHSNHAVAMNRRLLGEQHRWTGYSLINQGAILIDRGALDAASASIEAAAAIVEAVAGTDHIDYARILLERGRLALARREYGEAEAHLRAGQALARPRASSERTAIDRIEWALALALAWQNKPEGEALAESVRAGLAERFGAEDWRVRLKAASLELPPFASSPQPADIEHAWALIDALAPGVDRSAPRIAELAAQLEKSP